MMGALYLALVKWLSALLGNRVHLDLWRGQTENPSGEHPFLRPAVFVEFVPVDWEAAKHCGPSTFQEVVLHLVTDRYHDTHATSPDLDQSVNDWFGLVDNVEKKAHGQRLGGFESALRLIRSNYDTENRNLTHHRVTLRVNRQI